MILTLFVTWALVAVSLFNTILLLWLGLTLWLNANRRDLGIAVAAAGFLLGSAFFVGHAALLLSDTWQMTRSNTLWLAVAMTPVAILPYIWYLVLLRYNGFWLAGESDLRRRHRPWVALLAAVLLTGLGSLALLGLPYVPVFSLLTPWLWPVRDLVKSAVFGVPVVTLGYPIYVLGCVLLSLDALRRPGAAARPLGDLARGRARLWLVAASLLLTAVGALVAATLAWTITNTRQDGYFLFNREALEVIGRFDLAISLLIAGVVLLLGQAMTAYELFTEQPLPRRELARQWRRAILLAAAYGVLMGGALAWGLEPAYAALLTALLMTAFFALQGWRARVEWEGAMRQLRPLVTSQRWYGALTGQAVEPPSPDPFQALCENLLQATVAYLIPVGPIASLIAAQNYPADRTEPARKIADADRPDSPDLALSSAGALRGAWPSAQKIGKHPERSSASVRAAESKDAALGARPLRTLRLRAAALRSGCSASFSSAGAPRGAWPSAWKMADADRPDLPDLALSSAGVPSPTWASALGPLAQQLLAQDDLVLAVDPAQYGRATWAVALGREPRGAGLAGVLLLGPRRDDSLYTQEEIEIAQAAAERLMDLAAGVALSQRLMRLQRERMTATQVLDQRARRALHDEVLPLIHTAMLSLASGATAEAALEQLSAAHQEVSNLLRALPPTAAPEIARLGLVEALKRMVAVEFAAAFAEVTWDCEPGIEAQAARLSPLAAETLYYAAREAVRNAARHARPSDRPDDLRLAIVARAAEDQLQLVIRDNGPGLPQTPGAGQGLALHSTLMAVAGGSLTLETTPGAGTRVVLVAPTGV